MRLSILTPIKEFYKGDITSVTVKTIDGTVQIRRRHTPYIFTLSESVISIETTEGKRYAAVMAGFAEVSDGNVTLLTDAAEWPEEIDEERAKESKERALLFLREHELKIRESNEIDKQRASRAFNRAEVRLKLLLTKK